jgi:hypothetical protein
MAGIFLSCRSRNAAKVLAGTVAFMALTGQTSLPEPPQDREIVVTGKLEAPAALRERAGAYVRALGVANGQRAAARWLEPVCPEAVGVSEADARFVETEIRTAAQSLGIKTAKLPCTANVTISFVADAPAVVGRISARAPSQFREVPAGSLKSLHDGDAPIRWWYVTELRGKDGRSLSAATPPGVQIDGGYALPTGPNARVLSQYGASTVSTQTARALHSASILVDVERARGVTLGAVAAYAAMVGLAEIRFGAGAAPGSILALFDAPGTPAELSQWDRAFLCELYRLPLDRLARYQRGRLIGALAQGRDTPRARGEACRS